MRARRSIGPEIVLSLFQFRKAQEPERNDSQTLIAVTRGAWLDLCPISCLSKMSRHRFPHLFFHF